MRRMFIIIIRQNLTIAKVILMHLFKPIAISGILLLIGLLLTAQLASATTRVSTHWLERHLNNPNLLLINMTDDIQYQRFHIPGAVHLPYAAINYTTQNGVSMSVGREQLIKLLGLLGTSHESHIVIYDDLGGLSASRLYWELERLGHPRVALLDGGLVKWILEGRKVTNTPAQPASVTYQPSGKPGMANLASLTDIRRLPAEAVLLDVRSQQEYVGDPRQARSGHIPGARWWPWEGTVEFTADFRLKTPAELKRQLQALGVTDINTPIYVYCRTGHRASQAYFVLRQLGFTRVKLYDGSMAEYSQYKQLPVTKGLTP